MKSVLLLFAACLCPLNSAAWRFLPRDVNSTHEGSKLVIRQATCTKPTTTVTTTKTTTRSLTTTLTASTTTTRTFSTTTTYSTTSRITSTVTATTTKAVSTTTTYKTTITQTATVSKTTTVTTTTTTTNTKETTLTKTATSFPSTTCPMTTCPTATCPVCSVSSTSPTTSLVTTDATFPSGTTTLNTTDTAPTSITTALTITLATSTTGTAILTSTSSATVASCTEVSDSVTNALGGTFRHFYSSYGYTIRLDYFDPEYLNHPPQDHSYDLTQISMCDALKDCAQVTQMNGFKTMQFFNDISSGRWICRSSWTLLQDPTLFLVDAGVKLVYGFYLGPNVTTMSAIATVSTATTTSTTTTSTPVSTCAFMGSVTHISTASNGQRYSVYTDAYYTDYRAEDKLGEAFYSESEQDCLDSCESVQGCSYLVFSPSYSYCELYKDRTGGYCQMPSSDFVSGSRISSTAVSPSPSPKRCNAVNGGWFESGTKSMQQFGVASAYWTARGGAQIEGTVGGQVFSPTFDGNYAVFYGITGFASMTTEVDLDNDDYALSFVLDCTDGGAAASSSSSSSSLPQCQFTVKIGTAVISTMTDFSHRPSPLQLMTFNYRPAVTGKTTLEFALDCPGRQDVKVAIDEVALVATHCTSPY